MLQQYDTELQHSKQGITYCKLTNFCVHLAPWRLRSKLSNKYQVTYLHTKWVFRYVTDMLEIFMFHKQKLLLKADSLMISAITL